MFKWIRTLFIKRETNADESLNVVESMGKAKSLYKDLIVKAHPDRNPTNVDLATTLTDLINKNQFNYRELLKLKTRIETELK